MLFKPGARAQHTTHFVAGVAGNKNPPVFDCVAVCSLFLDTHTLAYGIYLHL